MFRDLEFMLRLGIAILLGVIIIVVIAALVMR
jgi:hypothetical protein